MHSSKSEHRVRQPLGHAIKQCLRCSRINTSRLWRRCKASKQEAVEWEHRFLSQFDYAWNRRCNAEARHVAPAAGECRTPLPANRASHEARLPRERFWCSTCWVLYACLSTCCIKAAQLSTACRRAVWQIWAAARTLDSVLMQLTLPQLERAAFLLHRRALKARLLQRSTPH